MKKLIIAGKEFDSRLFLGTGKFYSNTIMEESILASGCEMVTVAMKRIELDNSSAYPVITQHFGGTHRRRSRFCRTNGT